MNSMVVGGPLSLICRQVHCFQVASLAELGLPQLALGWSSRSPRVTSGRCFLKVVNRCRVFEQPRRASLVASSDLRALFSQTGLRVRHFDLSRDLMFSRGLGGRASQPWVARRGVFSNLLVGAAFWSGLGGGLGGLGGCLSRAKWLW